MAERGLEMLAHSLIIGVIIYIFLAFVIKTDKKVAENRSVLIAGLVMAYMVAFGHGAPVKLNENL
jgi:hypothetical protein